MANELTAKEQGVVALINNNELGDVLKPLIKEIHLFDTYVAGTTHLKDQSVMDTIKEGDLLSLQREDNRFDSNSVIIMTEDKRRLGFIPEKDNIIFARLMDAGKLLKARITKITDRGALKQINIGIYLVDF